MNARIRSLFAFTSNNNNRNNNQHLRGQAYEDAIASDPPVRGSYPVAGNGPNVLEQMQRSRAKREQRDQSRQRGQRDQTDHRRRSIRQEPVRASPRIPQEAPQIPPVLVAQAPDVPRRRRDDFVARPYTAPEEEYNTDIGYGELAHASTPMERTQSVFSMRSLPSSIFGSDRRDSVRSRVSTHTHPPLPVSPTVSSRHERASMYPASSTRSSRRFSQHVDLLDAYSDITQSNTVIKQKTRASGLRSYGEDVADRNIINYGEKVNRNSPHSSDPPKSRSVDTASATDLGHDLYSDGTTSPRDDEQPSDDEPITSTAFPPRVSSMPQSPRLGQNADYSIIANAGTDSRPTSSSSTAREIPPRDIRRLSHQCQQLLSHLSEPVDQGEALATAAPSIETYRPLVPQDRVSKHNPSATVGGIPELQTTSYRTQSGTKQDFDRITSERTRQQKGSVSYSAFPNTTVPRSRNTSTSSISFAPNPAVRHSSMSLQGLPQSSTASGPTTMNHSINLNNSTDFDLTKRATPGRIPFPHPSIQNHRVSQSTSSEGSASSEAFSTASTAARRSSYKNPQLSPLHVSPHEIEEPPSFPVYPRKIRARLRVVHEHITPVQHDIREEKMTREIHTLDVVYRFQPIIEKEILPPKHYVQVTNGDGREILVQVPESRLAELLANDSSGSHQETTQAFPRWRDQNDSSQGFQSHPTHDIQEEEESAEAPTIGLARGDPPKTRRRSRTWSISTNARPKSPVKAAPPFHTILNSSRKGSLTRDSLPRNEYVWHQSPHKEVHPAPRYVGPGIGDISGGEYEPCYSNGMDRPGPPEPARSEEELLFRDSGYGSGGTLPGLMEKAPMAKEAMGLGLDKPPGLDDVADENAGCQSALESVRREDGRRGEASRALRRTKERSSSVGHVRFTDQMTEDEGFAGGRGEA